MGQEIAGAKIVLFLLSCGTKIAIFIVHICLLAHLVQLWELLSRKQVPGSLSTMYLNAVLGQMLMSVSSYLKYLRFFLAAIT